MLYIMTKGKLCINVDNDADHARMERDGWRTLSEAEMTTAGMGGYEQIVGPDNTTVNEDGRITFNKPSAAALTEQFYASLRSTRDARLAATDKYMLADYPISEDNLPLVKAYRAALRDLPEQPGAPWDGGGEATPWPTMPEV